MKKSIKCGIVAAVAVAAGFAAYQSYGSYGAQNNSLMMQNIEALAQSTSHNEPDGEYGTVPNGKVNIVVSLTQCHKLVIDKKVPPQQGYYWYVDDKRKAANCKIIDVDNYKGQSLCKTNYLKNCSQYGGTTHEFTEWELGWH